MDILARFEKFMHHFPSPGVDSFPGLTISSRGPTMTIATKGRGGNVVQETVFFSNGQTLGTVEGDQVRFLKIGRLEQYRRNLEEIRQNRQWKTQGAGAAFMGVAPESEEPGEVRPRIGGLALAEGALYYTIHLGGVGSLCRRTSLDDAVPEGLVVSRQGMETFGLCWNGASFATTAAEGPFRHLAFFTLPRGDLTVVTQGETVESTPAWSQDCQQVYFSSAGMGRDAAGQPGGLGPRSLCRLDPNAMTLTELYSDPDRDCLSPQEGPDGFLYFLRRPRRDSEARGGAGDLAMAPVRVIRAVGGWLDLFTRRYAGESLRSGGDARAKQKSEGDLIIEGNLIRAEKALEENRNRGETFPGIIPGSWELARLDPGSDHPPETVAKGILAYLLRPDGSILLSNGRHILRREPDGRQTLLAQQPLVTLFAAGSLNSASSEGPGM
jgi:hypothetical protein